MPSELVLTSRAGGVAWLTLNRPRAINAINHTMVTAISTSLAGWEADPEIHTIVLDGAGDRGLCAGGDIRAIYEDILAGTGTSAQYWDDEYTLNSQISHLRTDCVALMDGLVMGGGLGLAVHARHRVVTDRTAVGMPEVSIGFTPDTGANFPLSRAPGLIGSHLVLTGANATGADAIYARLADYFVPASGLDGLRGALRESGDATATQAALAAANTPAPPAPLAAAREWIDACYGGETVEAILGSLAAHPHPGARAAAELISTKSPLALKVSLAAIRRAAGAADLDAVLDSERVVSAAFLATADLREGIRAQIIDKDRNPRWDPASLSEVSAADVAAFFPAPSPSKESAEKSALHRRPTAAAAPLER